MSIPDFPVSYPVNVEKLGNRTEERKIEWTEAERAAAAKAYHVPGIRSMTGSFVLRPWGRAGVMVSGEISGELEQMCVVTLEPFLSSFREDIEIAYQPEADSRRRKSAQDGVEIDIDMDAKDPPEPLIDGAVDLGAIICEHLALSIDPFPRKPGVEFVREQEGAEEVAEEKPSPFQKLEALKKGTEN